jgi:hypothetical protein
MKIYRGHISFSYESDSINVADDASDAEGRLIAWLTKKAEEIGFNLEVHDGDCWEDDR